MQIADPKGNRNKQEIEEDFWNKFSKESQRNVKSYHYYERQADKGSWKWALFCPYFLNAMDLSWLKTTLVIWKMKSRKSHGTCNKSEEKENMIFYKKKKLKVKLNTG